MIYRFVTRASVEERILEVGFDLASASLMM